MDFEYLKWIDLSDKYRLTKEEHIDLLSIIKKITACM